MHNNVSNSKEWVNFHAYVRCVPGRGWRGGTFLACPVRRARSSSLRACNVALSSNAGWCTIPPATACASTASAGSRGRRRTRATRPTTCECAQVSLLPVAAPAVGDSIALPWGPADPCGWRGALSSASPRGAWRRPYLSKLPEMLLQPFSSTYKEVDRKVPVQVTQGTTHITGQWGFRCGLPPPLPCRPLSPAPPGREGATATRSSLTNRPQAGGGV